MRLVPAFPGNDFFKKEFYAPILRTKDQLQKQKVGNRQYGNSTPPSNPVRAVLNKPAFFVFLFAILYGHY